MSATTKNSTNGASPPPSFKSSNKQNDLEKQKLPQPKPSQKSVAVKKVDTRRYKVLYCGAVSVALFIAAPIMLVLGNLQVRMAGTFSMGLAIYSIFVLGAVAFDFIDIMGRILFSWCLGVGVLVVVGVSSGLMYMQWQDTIGS
ncbi:hypothetical protein I9W82_003301 [Candida metapsilosis]|uniref:Uncharacterized protein n=1 Tax=Candida metapsilosis TaxID=273372 RepID=A0A8H7ZCX5_9ASCO|nr:hypothetical protein I9W82_003301 [Candida metapsilosis]